MKSYKQLTEAKGVLRHIAVHGYLDSRAKQHRSASKKSNFGTKESHSHMFIHHAYKHTRHQLMAYMFEQQGDQKAATQHKKLAAFHREKMMQEGHNEAAAHQLSKE